MRQFVSTSRPAELIHAFVDASKRSSGAGRMLLDGIESGAREEGFTEIVLNSGPRYKDTAWGFYDKVLGGRVGTIPNMYGEGRHAPVWRKEI